jgi:hypothetical protein
MVDPIQMLRTKKAKILADAQREAEASDADARELERLAALAEVWVLLGREAAERRRRPESFSNSLPLPNRHPGV